MRQRAHESADRDERFVRDSLECVIASDARVWCKRVLRVAPVPAARHVTPTFTGLTRASHILRIGSQHLARHPGFSNKQVLTRYPDIRFNVHRIMVTW